MNAAGTMRYPRILKFNLLAINKARAIGTLSTQRDGDEQCQNTKRHDERQIHEENLPSLPADQLDHADIAQMLIEQRVERIRDQRTGQEYDQNPQCQQDPQNRIDRICKRMFMGFCKAQANDSTAILLDLVFQFRAHVADMENIIPALGDGHQSTVEKLWAVPDIAKYPW